MGRDAKPQSVWLISIQRPALHHRLMSSNCCGWLRVLRSCLFMSKSTTFKHSSVCKHWRISLWVSGWNISIIGFCRPSVFSVFQNIESHNVWPKLLSTQQNFTAGGKKIVPFAMAFVLMWPTFKHVHVVTYSVNSNARLAKTKWESRWSWFADFPKSLHINWLMSPFKMEFTAQFCEHVFSSNALEAWQMHRL